MGFLRYYHLVLCTAWSHSISWAQSIIAIIVFIAGSAIWLARAFDMTIDSSSLMAMLHGSEFYAILVGSVVLVRLVCSPYWIWKDEHDARTKAEEALNDRDKRIQKTNVVATVIDEGNNIARTFENLDDTELIVSQYSSWEPRLKSMISNQLGASYIAQFNSARGDGLVLSGHSMEGNGYYALLQGKLKILNGFITELRNQ